MPHAFLIAGMNYKTLPVALREKLSFEPRDIPHLLRQLTDLPGIAEAALLSTCNRFEIHMIADLGEVNLSALKALFPSPVTSDQPSHWDPLKNSLFGTSQKGPDARQSEETRRVVRWCTSQAASTRATKQMGLFQRFHWYEHRAADAIRHLYRLTGGLDSMVLGESQIFRQVKDAYQLAAECGTVQSRLHELYHRAFAVGKRVRTETGIGVGSTSVSSLAIELIETSVCFRSPPRLLVIGAGEAGASAAKTFSERGLGSTIIINRTLSKATSLAQSLGAEVRRWEAVAETLSGVEAVISCVGSPDPFLTTAMIEKAIHSTERGTLTLIDLGVPRDIDPKASEIAGVTLFNIDDLEGFAAKHRLSRSTEAAAAERIIKEEVERTLEEAAGAHLTPTIAHLMRKCDEIRRQELDRTMNRLAHLSDADRKLMEACTNSIVAKILHDPITALKTSLSCDASPPLHDALRHMFRLEEK